MEQQEAVRVAREEAVALRAKIRHALFADQTAGAAKGLHEFLGLFSFEFF